MARLRCRVGESHTIAENITVTVVEVDGDYVQLNIAEDVRTKRDGEEEWFNPDIDYDMYLQD